MFVDLVLAEGHWHMRQVENHARCLRMMGNRTTEDMATNETDFQLFAGRIDRCENLVQHNGSVPSRWFWVHPLCSWPRS